MRHFQSLPVIILALLAFPALGGDQAQSVGKDGLKIEGKVTGDDPKVKIDFVADKGLDVPAKSYSVKLSGGKKYKITVDGPDFDPILSVHSPAGKQIAFDDDGVAGTLNSLLEFECLKDATFKLYVGALNNSSGPFKLTIVEDGAIKVHEPGAKIEGNLTTENTKFYRTYNFKLAAGKTYVIDMKAEDKAMDPFLHLLDADYKELAKDDDGGEGLNSRITHKATAAGVYQIVATAVPNAPNSIVGRFTLTVEEKKE